MRRTLLLAVLLLIALLAMNCGTLTAVRALREGESALALSCGGPVTRVSGLDIPLPYAVAGYRYGVNDRFGVYAGGHLLLLALGEAGLDGGFSYQLARQEGWVPELGVAAGLTGMIRPGGDERLFPGVSIAASHLFRNRFLTYLGAQGMLQLGGSPVLAWAPVLGEKSGWVNAWHWPWRPNGTPPMK